MDLAHLSRIGILPGGWLEEFTLAGEGRHSGRRPRSAGIIAIRPPASVVEVTAAARKSKFPDRSAYYHVCMVEKKNGKKGFPKGGRAVGESVWANAFREWWEETGIALKRLQIRKGVYLDEARVGVRYLLAFCEPLSSGDDGPEPAGTGEMSWSPPFEDGIDDDPIVKAHWVCVDRDFGLERGRKELLHQALAELGIAGASGAPEGAPLDKELSGSAACEQCGAMACEEGERFCASCWGSACVVCGKWRSSLRRIPDWAHPLTDTRSENVWACRSCRQTTSVEEAQALATAPAFAIWQRGRREDSHDYSRNLSAPDQPARILPWLFLGDYDDATNLPHLKVLGITAVLSLCEDRHAPGLVESHLTSGVELVPFAAKDDFSGDFDIIAETWPQARERIAKWRAQRRSVLVNCWGGVNRSSAVVVAWLLAEESFSLREAVHRVTALRGTVLTNRMFRLQLLRLSRQITRERSAVTE